MTQRVVKRLQMLTDIEIVDIFIRFECMTYHLGNTIVG